MPESFPSLVAGLRKERGWMQSELAQKVKLGGKAIGNSTISHFERGEISIAYETGLKIIDALEPDKSARRKLEQALKIYVKLDVEPKSYKMGKVLDEIMKEYELTDVWLAGEVDKSHQLIQQIRTCTKLPSGEILEKLMAALKSKDIPVERLLKMKSVHLYDVLMTDPRLAHLTTKERKALADYGSQHLWPTK